MLEDLRPYMCGEAPLQGSFDRFNNQVVHDVPPIKVSFFGSRESVASIRQGLQQQDKPAKITNCVAALNAERSWTYL
jgi:hypothetical protein